MLLRSTAVFAAALLAGTLAATPALETGPAVHVTAQTIQSALAPGSPLRAKLLSRAWSAPGTPTEEYAPRPADFPPVVETPIDVGPAPTTQARVGSGDACAPAVTKAKGKLTSGGYIVIEGACFGKDGSVLITGFPTGLVQPKIEAWTPTAITAQLPTISGVPDLTMQVLVQSGARSAKPFAAKYVAALGDPLPLPPRYLVNNECAGGPIPGLCEVSASHPAIGSHADLSQQSGADVWTLSIPAHFRLHAIRLVHLAKGATTTSTIDASASGKTFKIAWTENANAYMTATTQTQSTSSSGSGLDDIFGDIATGGALAALNSGSSTKTKIGRAHV